MELKYYLQALLRRWWVALLVPLLVLIFGGWDYMNRDPSYSADAKVVYMLSPDTPVPSEFEYDDYYNYLASEFAIDDLVEIVKGNVFAEAVAERLRTEGQEIGTGEVQAALSATREHRVLTITSTTGDPDRSVVIARAAQQEVQEGAARFLVNRSTADGPAIVQSVQVPTGADSDQGRARLLLILSLIVGIGAGVVLAFVIDYLDDRVQDADGVSDALGLPILASLRDRR